MNLNLHCAIGAMSLIANMGRQGHLDSLGISKADFDRFIGSSPWMASDRGRMITILHNLMNASVDAQGMPRFVLPAEYLAAAIALFVHPVNAQAACIYGVPSPTAADLSRGIQGPKCSPEQLFGQLVQLFDSPDRSSARATFERLSKLALTNLSKEESNAKAS